MTNNNYYWMKYAIKIADKIDSELIRVSALVVNNDQLIEYSSTNNIDCAWADNLIIKLKNKKITKIENLYLTINTLNDKEEFDLNKLLNTIEVENIFIGLPDPKLNCYLDNDPVLNNKNIFRFNDELQENIFKQNYNLYKESKQNIKYSEYYYSNRISRFLKEKLDLYGIKLEFEEISQQKQVEKLSAYISKKFNISGTKLYKLITSILSDAFDYKYSAYNYANDIRSVNTNWSKVFNDIYNKTNNKSLNEINILNIGVGGGNEARELFFNCADITFVDIAPNGLKKVKKIIPASQIIQERAENLQELTDNSYDLYVSLRTYNSSFFDVKQALKEAYRVLKNNAVIIISISNGFLDTKEKKIIPGIIIPGLDFVDLYRGLDMFRNLLDILLDLNFVDIELTPTNGEIYISAKVNKNQNSKVV